MCITWVCICFCLSSGNYSGNFSQEPCTTGLFHYDLHQSDNHEEIDFPTANVPVKDNAVTHSITFCEMIVPTTYPGSLIQNNKRVMNKQIKYTKRVYKEKDEKLFQQGKARNAW